MLVITISPRSGRCSVGVRRCSFTAHQTCRQRGIEGGRRVERQRVRHEGAGRKIKEGNQPVILADRWIEVPFGNDSLTQSDTSDSTDL